ncbi:hypothetical protein NIM87_09450 [Devosia sp. XJ19-1]|uniref:Uncharacterized protein n=1 Tax=Devosia ureilytica TaxID=2952754 RepID=A0A9Q4AP93_9HYPH|nr:hypothetical protein [Devosia ureilytica]MCP8883722.1 hypothetical protein [Devosia ureilytica]MCP8887330.1 hypothetical protein [Devosia ureilytica]
MNVQIDPRTMLLDAAPHYRSRTAITALQLVALIGEILLVACALGGVGWGAIALGHIGIIAALIFVVVGLERMNIETGSLQAFILLTFAGGPIGAAAAALADLQNLRPQSDALDKWYRTIAPLEAPAVTLVDLIIDGRLVRQQSRLPRPYDALLSSGTMQEKQALLAYLAIENDQKFVEVALALALRSTDQRVRVQAAAVAAYTRGKSRQRQLSGLGTDLIQDAIARPKTI